ncbi:hypothetical protein [Haloprofundus salinisoli]|uniref:hypothetical protein n=1 Tax=Haloprofundus salinisoli TaxID=2876193 RepID=UPI001CCE97D3|nr:hypothetical protein [Haloprofundus salinisoli]
MPEYEDDDRYATQRARYLSRKTELRMVEAKAVAYSERGYSVSGMARAMDTNPGTAQGYLELAEAQYGFEITETTHLPGEEVADYEPVEPGYHETLARKDAQTWVDLVEKHQKRLPATWAHNVLDAAREDGFTPSTK